MIVAQALLAAFGLSCLVLALMLFRLAVRDWAKLMGMPLWVRIWGLGFLGGFWLLTAGLLFAAAAAPRHAKLLLLVLAGVWIARGIAMRFTAGRVNEALPPDDIEGYIELTRVSPVPIATGEVLTRRQSFLPWLERRAVDIIQPDSTKNGGLSESRRIAWMAYDHNIQMVSHGWNTALGVAADLQLAAAMPIARYVEYLTPCAYIEDLTTEPFRIDAEGYLEIPSKPGLGVEIDREKLKKYDARR